LRHRITIVSIPHRYAENEGMSRRLRRWLKFQFLIGTLKTPEPERIRGTPSPFQFLIGTLKTYHGNPPTGKGPHVSIPHRYAENFTRKSGPWPNSRVSIPHRYAENFYVIIFFV